MNSHEYNSPNKKRQISNVFTVPITGYEDEISSQEDIISKALNYHKNGDILKASKLYRICIKRGYIDFRVYSNLGVICKQKGRVKEAINLFEKSIYYYPNRPEAYSNLGNILYDIGKTEEALNALNRAIKLRPNFSDAYYNRARIYAENFQLSEAESSIIKVIQCNPSFANAYNLLGGIMQKLGRFSEAETAFIKALELKPGDQNFSFNFLGLLSIYKSSNRHSNILVEANNELSTILYPTFDKKMFMDTDVKNFYKKCLNIYNKYNINLETKLTQVYKRNNSDLNCERHKQIFQKYEIIPKFCFGCYKVQVIVPSVVQLIKLFFLFDQLPLNNNTRKCMIELRENMNGFYKGLIYCSSLEEANSISTFLNYFLGIYINKDLRSTVKRGCSEYATKFPSYNDLNQSVSKLMSYKEDWKSIEKDFDKTKRQWTMPQKSVEGFSLNNFLIFRNWLAYAQKIGDKSVEKITKEKIYLSKR